ncbi:hypothetical protein ACVRWQ_05890 [Streptococcus phocae subsp. salmonis]|uniref:hypothetical protein n=1 Tax=Streptococcus phocae TaxID=119224 RepID=UPI0005312BE8|nr:hypothetical protein [Streptococcus phocae]KGR72875.1 phage protein [Streptococcus phocae subsp. salmonis]QBX27820.1 hypothetical protein Javan420_0020 [Streptococcus phage Javan420]
MEMSEDWEANYFEVQKVMGEEIDMLQKRIAELAKENKRLRCENWQLRNRKRK